MLDFDALRTFIGREGFRPLFVTVSGAHLYGFPSPDSDIDLRGCHQAQLVASKVAEQAAVTDLDWPFHAARLDELEQTLERAFAESTLPEERDRTPINELLVRLRLG